MDIKIAPSIMAGNFSQEAVDSVKTADLIHIDIMDGEFVPNKTIWYEQVEELETDLPKDVHLMIMNPEEVVDEFIDAGAGRISFHIEATENPEAVIGLVQHRGVEVGIALNPETSADKVMPFLEDVDFVLVMSVHPGKGGQEFIEDVLPKIELIRSKFPNLDIAVDGGINADTAKGVVEAGANILISGSYLFSENVEERISKLKQLNFG